MLFKQDQIFNEVITIFKIENVSEYLKNNGIKPSYQRLKIFEYLVNTTEHPTVDTIYKALIDDIPTLSKTTVYNTLNLFVENKIATVVTIEENEARYDADTSIHGHFKCEHCGKVYDFGLDISKLTERELDGFKIHHQHVYYRGICKHCAKNDRMQKIKNFLNLFRKASTQISSFPKFL